MKGKSIRIQILLLIIFIIQIHLENSKTLQYWQNRILQEENPSIQIDYGSDEDTLKYYIPCTHNLSDSNKVQITFPNILNEIDIVYDNCDDFNTFMSGKQKLAFFFLLEDNFYQDGEEIDPNMCQLKEIEILELEDCATYDIIFSTILISSESLQENPETPLGHSQLKYNEKHANIEEFKAVEIEFFREIYMEKINFRKFDENGLIFNELQKLVIQNCIFQNHTYKEHSLDIDDTVDVFMYNCIIINNITSKDIAGGKVDDFTYFEMKNCYFDNNVADEEYGSAFRVTDGTTIVIDTVTFENSAGNVSGSLGILGISGTVTINNVELLNNQAEEFAGGIYFEKIQDLIISNCLVKSNESTSLSGGGIYTESIYGTVTIRNTNFYNNQAGSGGSAIYSVESNKFILEDCIFEQNSGGIGTVSVVETPNIVIRRCIFNQNSSESGSGIYIENKETSDIESEITDCEFTENIQQIQGALYLNGAKNVKNMLIKDNIFRENATEKGFGGGFAAYSVQGNLIVKDCEFLNNSAFIKGGGAFFANCIQTVLENLFFENNTSTQGGAIYATEGSFMSFNELICSKNNDTGIVIYLGDNYNISNLFITENKGISVGGIHFDSISDSNIQQIQVEQSQAYNYGGIYISNSENSNFSQIITKNNIAIDKFGGIHLYKNQGIYINDIKVLNNTSEFQSSGIGLEQEQSIIINNLYSYNNTSQDNGAGIHVFGSTDVTIKNSKIYKNQARKNGGGIFSLLVDGFQLKNVNILENQSLKKDGGGISFESCKDITFEKLNLKKNQGLSGGAIYGSYSENYTFKDGEILQNIAVQNGGSIQLIEVDNVYLQEIIIKQNQADYNGGGLFLQNVQNFVMKIFEIIDNTILHGFGAGVYISQNSNNLSFIDGEILENIGFLNGGGMYIHQTGQVTLNQVRFLDNSVSQKGAQIYSELSENLTVYNCIFLCEQQLEQPDFGNAVYSDNTQNIVINHTQFRNNKVHSQGGAIYINNSEDIQINYNLFDQNKVDNQKQYTSFKTVFFSGGSIYIQNSDNFSLQNNVIQNSYSENFGGGVYLYDLSSIYLNQNTFTNCKVNYQENLSEFSKNEKYDLSQGGGIYIQTLQKQESSIEINSSKFQECYASSGGGIFINNNFGKNIELSFDNLQFLNNKADLGPGIRVLGDKDQTYTKKYRQFIELQTNNIGYLNNTIIFDTYYYNEKLKDEKFADYELCSSGYESKEGGTEICEQCNKNGICSGGYIPVIPKEQYWRINQDSYNFIHCAQKPELCKGNDTCAEGYTGVLCESCDILNNYSSKGDLQCFKCANNSEIYINLSILFIISTIILGNQIKGVYQRVNKQLIQKCMNIMFQTCYIKYDQLPGITKIFVSHFQIFYLIVSFTLDVPVQVGYTIEIFGNPQQVFSKSANCLLPVKEKEEIQSFNFYISFIGLGLTIGTLFMLFFIEFILFLNGKFIKNINQLLAFIKCSILCFYLMIQPGLLQNSLNFSVCRNIGGISYNSADTNIRCDSDFYKMQVFPVNLCLVLMIGVVIPIFLSILLIKRKNQTKYQTLNDKKAVGILYLGYKDKYYYWEILSLLCKIIIATLSIVFQQQGSIKAVLLTIVLVGYFAICLFNQPFATKQLNNLSILSTVSLAISVVFAKCVKDIQDEESQVVFKFIFSILIVCFNSTFIIFSAKYIVKDPNFVDQLRVLSLKYLKNFDKINVPLLKQIQKEKKAKQHWKKIIYGVHKANQVRKQLKKEDEAYNHYDFEYVLAIILKDIKQQMKKSFNLNTESGDYYPNLIKQSEYHSQRSRSVRFSFAKKKSQILQTYSPPLKPVKLTQNDSQEDTIPPQSARSSFADFKLDRKSVFYEQSQQQFQLGEKTVSEVDGFSLQQSQTSNQDDGNSFSEELEFDMSTRREVLNNTTSFKN